ncbi:MAG: hypothetical protein J1E62_03245 [Lachnospiraceae bacterium]|nr:hypothetical protein [Lachnospiraceae bacterium]
MAFVYNDDSYALILAFPDNCPGCNESYVKWNYVHHEMISRPTKVYHSGKKEYSVGKGLAGAALLGPIGALAGVNGKKTHGYTTKEGEYSYRISAQCPKCGYLHEITSRSYPKFKEYKTEEEKKVLGIEEIEDLEDLAKRLSSTIDLSSKIEEALTLRPMKIENIFEYLKENNYLPEEVLSAEKKAEGCITADGRNLGWSFKLSFLHRTLSDLEEQKVVCRESITYRLLTEQEKISTEKEEAKKVEIDNLAKRLSTIVDLPSKIEEALLHGPKDESDIYEYLKKKNYLPEAVLSAEKKAEGCITADGGNLGWYFKMSFLIETMADLLKQGVVRRKKMKYKLLSK